LALNTVVSIQNFGVFCFSGENFVTPFSTLANIKGSRPINSTAPDRLRWRTKTDGEDFPAVLGFKRRQNKVFSKGPTSSAGDLHSKRSP